MSNTSAQTLEKLQQLKLIEKIQFIFTNSTRLVCPNKAKSSNKLLLKNNIGIIYYGLINSQGPNDPHAVCIFADGSYYEGQFKNGKPNGAGKLTKKRNEDNIHFYEGQWKNGLPDGFGIECISPKIRYEGQFQKGVKSGKGKLIQEDGSVFEGNFKNNQVQGSGRYNHKNFTWEGNWQNGYLQGEGKQTALNSGIGKEMRNSQYIGSFHRGNKHGYGKYIWSKEREYQGNFNRGQIDGEGILRVKSSIFKGLWQRGTELKLYQQEQSKSKIIISDKNDPKI